MRNLKYEFLIVFFAFLLFSPTSSLANAPYPATPSKEELDKLYELGRQNELRYGRGPAAKSPTKKPPTLTPTATPTIIPSPTIIVKKHQIYDLPFFIQWIIKFFSSFFTVTTVIETAPTPTLTPTIIPTRSPSADALWQKGFNIWVGTKDYAKASEYYKQALKINPNHVPTLASYGYILGAFYNRFTDGEAMLKKAMSLGPTWAYAPYNLGLLYDISGRRDDGIYWLQYTVDKFPSHPDIEWFRDHLRVAKEWKY